MKYLWLIIAVAFLPHNAFALTPLTTATTFWFNPASGNDTTGTGTSVLPFKSPCGAWTKIAATYDLNQKPITIQWQGGASKITCDLQITGRLVGQTGAPTQVVIQGDPNCNSGLPSTATNCNPTTVAGVYVWSPAPNPPAGHVNAITVTGGAIFRVVGFDFEMMDAMSGGSNIWGADDMINQGSSEMWLSDIVFGATLSPHNDLSVQNLGRIFIDGNVLFKSNTAQAAFGVGQMSMLQNTAGGVNGKNYALSAGVPTYGWGMMFADEFGDINWAGVPIMQAEASAWHVVSTTVGSADATVDYPSWFSPGFYIFSPYFPALTTVVSISGSTVTFSQPATATVASGSAMIGAAAQVYGPAMTLWLNSALNAGGSGSVQFPGTAPIETSTPTVGNIWGHSTLQ